MANFQNLKNHIMPKSVNRYDFNEAKKEWELDYIIFTEEFGNCPCGRAIKEHCYIKNMDNGETTHVGNVCVKRFMEIDASKLFRGLKRIQRNNKAKPNPALIEYAQEQGYLYGDNEYEFLQNIKRRRELSERQENWLTKINRRIVEKIVVQRLPDEDDED